MIKKEIQKLIAQELKKEDVFEINVECPADPKNGDYSSNIALRMDNPLESAQHLARNIKSGMFSKIEAVKPGFLNFYLSESFLQKKLKEIIKEKDRFGCLPKKNQTINVEFISANPTGPLTLGNGRGGFCGDVLARVLEKAGYIVCREYYINDRGVQIEKLGHSILKDDQAVYKGEYIDQLSKRVKGDYKEAGEKASSIILEEMIKPTVKRMGIDFDVWFSEKTLYQDSSVDRTIKDLKKRGFTYVSEKAIWFKSKDLEDDKDRVLIRSDGQKTYFASDIAYLKNKFQRGFKTLVIFLGADHYGYVQRIKAATHALGFNKEEVRVVVMQLVHLSQDGKEVKMSKREGTYVTLDELLDEISLDVARFFFLQRSSDTHLNFDLNLAKEQSSNNPVYYVQYAHARMSSILKKKKPYFFGPNLRLLKEKQELGLIKQLLRFPEIVDQTSIDFQVQRICQYSLDLADSFHQFYEICKVLTKKKDIQRARMALCSATRNVLRNILSLMGVNAPEKM